MANSESIKVSEHKDVELIEQNSLDDHLSLFNSTYDVLYHTAQDHPDKTALIFLADASLKEDPQTFTYGELLAAVNQTANMFQDFGIKPDSVISYVLPNTPETHFTLWASEAVGIVNPINPLLEANHIADIMNAAESRILVTAAPGLSAGIWSKVQSVIPMVPSLQTVFTVGEEAGSDRNVFSFNEIRSKFPVDRPNLPDDPPDRRIASYFHTGGTTGAPKLAQHTHKNEIYNAWALMIMAGLTSQDRLLCGLPLFHVNAVVVTGLAPFMAGAAVVLLTPNGYRNPNVISNFWKIIEQQKATFFSGVPTIFTALLDVSTKGMDLSSLRYAICGASPMPMEVFRKFERISGVKILEGYGLTEGTCVSCLNPKDGERRVGSIGFRLPYQSMKVARLDEKGCFSDECAPNEIGSVLIKGPNVIPGYKSEKDNEGLWAEEGWLNTGDLGRKDEDGYFWLAGRTKDLIIRGGHNIDSSIIEEALHKHPDVVMAAAVGKPDSYAGELPVAYVVLSPNAGTTEDDLKAHLRTVISERAALPKDITLLDAMPQTAVGKVFKPELRWRAAQKVFSQALTFLTEENVKFEVKVGADDTHGTLAVISLTEIDPLKRTSLESRISRILNTFALSFRIR